MTSATTEAEWLEGDDPERMLAFLHGCLSARKRRLLACACAASIWDLLHRKDRVLIVWQREHPDEALLTHLRSPGPHVCGCWALVPPRPRRALRFVSVVQGV